MKDIIIIPTSNKLNCLSNIQDQLADLSPKFSSAS